MTVHVSDLTVDELQSLLRVTMRELMEELLEERFGTVNDPDAGMTLPEDVATSLEAYLASPDDGDDAALVFRRLGLE